MIEANPCYSTFAFNGFTKENYRSLLHNDNHKSNVHLESLLGDALKQEQPEIDVCDVKFTASVLPLMQYIFSVILVNIA